MSTPLATIVIERAPEQGYRVTSATGPHAEMFKESGLKLLDQIGQPDPTGPLESLQWIGPSKQQPYPVAVQLQRQPSGEVTYRQIWFPIPEAPWVVNNKIKAMLLMALLLGLALGILGQRSLFPTTTNDPINKIKEEAKGKVIEEKPILPATQKQSPNEDRLKLMAEGSQELRNKLKTYLSQEPFPAPNSQVVDIRSSIELRDDLPRAPPERHRLKINNVEVRQLLDLLDALDHWTNNNH